MSKAAVVMPVQRRSQLRGAYINRKPKKKARGRRNWRRIGKNSGRDLYILVAGHCSALQPMV
jgi:hypothetical protein